MKEAQIVLGIQANESTPGLGGIVTRPAGVAFKEGLQVYKHGDR